MPREDGGDLERRIPRILWAVLLYLPTLQNFICCPFFNFPFPFLLLPSLSLSLSLSSQAKPSQTNSLPMDNICIQTFPRLTSVFRSETNQPTDRPTDLAVYLSYPPILSASRDSLFLLSVDFDFFIFISCLSKDARTANRTIPSFITDPVYPVCKHTDPTLILIYSNSSHRRIPSLWEG